MLSSQQRNTNGSKLHLCKHANAFASVVEAMPTHRTTKRRGCPSRSQAIATDLFLCHLLPVGQWQSLPAVWSYRIILFETGATLRFKAATVIKGKVSYG